MPVPETDESRFAAVELLAQAVRHSRSTRRSSVRTGLRVAAAGCGFALVYVAYKLARLVDLGLGQARRRRWEVQSFNALASLWQDLSAAMPEIVLASAQFADVGSQDADFLLQRRVIEISDGLLALRPNRPRRVQELAQEAFEEGTEKGAAAVEAAVVKAALASSKVDQIADEMALPPANGASRKDLRTDTQWLLLVAAADVRHLPR